MGIKANSSGARTANGGILMGTEMVMENVQMYFAKLRQIGSVQTGQGAKMYSGDLEAFAEWVARQVCREDFDEDGTFAEMACRRLWKLGFVRMNGEHWEYGEVEE